MKYIKAFFTIKRDEPMAIQLFNIILVMVILLSVINIIVNISLGYPFGVSIKWIVTLIVSGLVRNYYRSHTIIKYLYVMAIILILLPVGWMNSGADNNNVIAYVFLTVICLSFMFQGWERLSLVATTIVVISVIILLEYLMPEILTTYSIKISLPDRLIQISMSLITSYLILKIFADAYHRNNKKLVDMNKHLERIAYTDALTNVYNRAFIFEKLEEAIENKESFVTMIADIDDFKLINDNHGHLVGDKVLMDFAEALELEFGPYGYVSRYGGDEFILLLFLDLDEVQKYMKNFYDRFNQLEFVELCQVTISGGYDIFQQDTLDQHLSIIDKALYHAKATGKNKILLADQENQNSREIEADSRLELNN